MNFSYGHGWELLYLATGALAAQKGRIRERLIQAFTYQLSGLGEEELEPELWEKFSSLYQEVTSEPATTGEGAITASINRMSEDRASAIASEIFDIFHSHSKTYWTTP